MYTSNILKITACYRIVFCTVFAAVTRAHPVGCSQSQPKSFPGFSRQGAFMCDLLFGHPCCNSKRTSLCVPLRTPSLHMYRMAHRAFKNTCCNCNNAVEGLKLCELRRILYSTKSKVCTTRNLKVRNEILLVGTNRIGLY